MVQTARKLEKTLAIGGRVGLWGECKRRNIQVLFSHVNPQPMSVIQKAGFYDEVGEENFQPNIDAALERAVVLREQTEAHT